MKRIGLFAGTFDPVHIGHIKLALEAVRKCNLDKVYFMPERQPSRKTTETDLKERVQRLKKATKDYRSLAVLEFPEEKFSVEATLPQLQTRFPNSELFLLLGSDVASQIPRWPKVEQLLASVNLIIALRGDDKKEGIEAKLHNLRVQPKITFIKSPHPNISSTQVRSIKTIT